MDGLVLISKSSASVEVGSRVFLGEEGGGVELLCAPLLTVSVILGIALGLNLVFAAMLWEMTLPSATVLLYFFSALICMESSNTWIRSFAFLREFPVTSTIVSSSGAVSVDSEEEGVGTAAVSREEDSGIGVSVVGEWEVVALL